MDESTQPQAMGDQAAGAMKISRPWRVWLAGLIIFCVLVWLLRSILAPFLVGIAIAYICDPAVERLDRSRRLPRWVGTIIVLSGFLVIALAVLLVIAPVLQRQLAAFLADVPTYVEMATERLQPIWAQFREELTREEVQRLTEAAGSYAGDALGWLLTLLGGLWRGGMAVFDVISFLVVTPVVAFYLLRDWKKLETQVESLLPRGSRETITSLLSEIDKTLASFIRGQGLVCLIQGTFYAVALSLVGLNFGILVGFSAGVLSFIPYVGTALGFIASTGIAVVQFSDPMMWVVVIGIFMAGQVLESVLTPMLVGDSVGLHPVWVMFGLFAGGALAGFTGILLAVPVAAVIGVLVRFSVERYRESSLFLGDQAGDEEVEADGAIAAGSKSDNGA